jgi:hypothetical protein
MQRLLLYATMGTLLDLLGYSWQEWQFMCLLGLFCAVELVGRMEGHQAAAHEYIEALEAAEQELITMRSLLATARGQLADVLEHNKARPQ